MISIQKNFLFIHVPKTGGNSIQTILKNYSEDNIVTLAEYQDGIERFTIRNSQYDITKHSTLHHYQTVMTPNIFQRLFKFSTIRNPWDRCISFYFSSHRGNMEWDRDSFIKIVEDMPTLGSYLTLGSTGERIKRKSASGQDIKPIYHHIDFLIRFEQLNEDFKKVCQIIDIPMVELPHKNRSLRKHYATYYDDELIELVKNKFSDEINYGHYIYGE